MKRLAGAGGFEPPHGGTKIRCLTAWLRPNLLGSPRLIYLAFLPGTSVALRGTTAEHSSVAPKLHPSSPPNKPGNSGAFARNNSCSVGRPSAQKKNPRDGGIRQFAVPTIHAATRTKAKAQHEPNTTCIQ